MARPIHNIFRVAAVRVVGLGLTVGLAMLQAAAFGSGPAGDAFHLIRQTVASTTSAIESGLQKLFVPHFVAKGGDGAQAGRVLVLILLASAAVSLLLWIAAPWVVTIMAPGFDEGRAETATQLFRILVFALPCYAVTSILTSRSFAGRKFTFASAATLLPRVFALVGFALAGLALDARHLTAWLLAGMVAMGLVMLVQWWRSPRAAPPRLDAASPMTLNRTLAIAVFFFMQVLLTWSAGFLASFAAAGTTALLFLSLRLLNVVPALGNTAVSTVYFTEYAHDALDRNAQRAQTMQASLSASALFVLPVMSLILFSAEDLVRLVMERGAFTARDSALMAEFMRWMTPTLLLNAVNAAFFAAVMADPTSPLLRVALVTGMASLLARLGVGMWLVPGLGLMGMAVALLAGNLAQVVALVGMSGPLRVGVFSPALAVHLARIAAASGLAGLVAWMLSEQMLVIELASFVCVFLAAGFLFRVPEIIAFTRR